MVPGSAKVTRCTSKPAPLRTASIRASAPASAGVTDGQRSKSRARAMGSMAALQRRATPEVLERLRAELDRQKIVLVSHPAWDQERIDQDPEDRDRHPHDRDRQDQLRDRNAGALEIEVVTSKQAHEEPEEEGDQSGFFIGL